MGLGTRFGPGAIGTPLSVVGGLLDELVGALAKSAKGCEGDGLEADVQVLLLNDLGDDRNRGSPADPVARASSQGAYGTLSSRRADGGGGQGAHQLRAGGLRRAKRGLLAEVAALPRLGAGS